MSKNWSIILSFGHHCTPWLTLRYLNNDEGTYEGSQDDGLERLILKGWMNCTVYQRQFDGILAMVASITPPPSKNRRLRKPLTFYRTVCCDVQWTIELDFHPRLRRARAHRTPEHDIQKRPTGTGRMTQLVVFEHPLMVGCKARVEPIGPMNQTVPSISFTTFAAGALTELCALVRRDDQAFHGSANDDVILAVGEGMEQACTKHLHVSKHWSRGISRPGDPPQNWAGLRCCRA